MQYTLLLCVFKKETTVAGNERQTAELVHERK